MKKQMDRRIPKQYAAVMIYVILVDTDIHTDKQLLTGYGYNINFKSRPRDPFPSAFDLLLHFFR